MATTYPTTRSATPSKAAICASWAGVQSARDFGATGYVSVATASQVTSWDALGISVRFLRRFVAVSPPSPVGPHMPSAPSKWVWLGAGFSHCDEMVEETGPAGLGEIGLGAG